MRERASQGFRLLDMAKLSDTYCRTCGVFPCTSGKLVLLSRIVNHKHSSSAGTSELCAPVRFAGVSAIRSPTFGVPGSGGRWMLFISQSPIPGIKVHIIPVREVHSSKQQGVKGGRPTR